MFNGVFGLKQEKLSFPPVRRVRDMKSENWEGLSWRYRRSTIVADVQGGLVFALCSKRLALITVKTRRQ